MPSSRRERKALPPAQSTASTLAKTLQKKDSIKLRECVPMGGACHLGEGSGAEPRVCWGVQVVCPIQHQAGQFEPGKPSGRS